MYKIIYLNVCIIYWSVLLDNAGDLGSILRLERSPGEGKGNPLQYSCLENPHGQISLTSYSPQGHKKLDRSEKLSTAHNLINNVVIVSGRQQRDSVIHTHVSILPPNSPPIQATT